MSESTLVKMPHYWKSHVVACILDEEETIQACIIFLCLSQYALRQKVQFTRTVSLNLRILL